MDHCRNVLRTLSVVLIVGLGFFSEAAAQSGDPIRIGMSLALTGAGASPSKVINTALEIWRDDINGKGGLLGRPLELVIYDDQSSPANVPNIYTKLITVDKVDLLLGPYGTNFVAPAMPTIMNNQKMTITFTAIGINDNYHSPKYFSMVSTGRASIRFRLAFLIWPQRSSQSRGQWPSLLRMPSSPKAQPTVLAGRSRNTASIWSMTRAIRQAQPISRP
jgi:hypothetical protein